MGHYAIGISKGVCESLERDLKVKKNRIFEIPNCIDLSKFEFDTNYLHILRDKYKEEFNIPEENVIIGMCANFRKQKNHRCLINACYDLLNRGVKNFRLILCGTGPEFHKIKLLILEKHLENNIILVGARQDIPELMSFFDIYCLPSLFEGLPLSILEAMASELAIVATNVEGNNDLIAHGTSGLLVESNNPIELSRNLERLIVDLPLRNQLAKAAKNNSERYSLEVMMNEYDKLFSGAVCD